MSCLSVDLNRIRRKFLLKENARILISITSSDANLTTRKTHTKEWDLLR